MPGQKILITGGAGFIGSNLADALVDDNEVVVVDDLSMGKIDNLPNSNHIHFFKHSITDYEFINELLVAWKFDYIYLLAAVASVADTIKRPRYTHEVNQNANLNILETVRVNKLAVKKIIFSSSAAVYGNNPVLPKSEKSAIDPLTPYAIDKYATERFVIDYGKLYGISTVATRFFNVYGPKQNPQSPYSGVLSLISKSIIENKVFNIYGDGQQTRDFIYIDDVIDALIILTTHDSAVADVYNVATGEKNSLNTVINVFNSGSLSTGVDED
ncbi:NAD-dependent epimerase/dehydratase family protein [Levilactobacillus zymae]|uniref:NAD-dependent epimerase/dehydratase family protein n=1 Tax=Levilactobacillus zymae TaxID=267363 RepID=UPI003FCE7196